VTPAATPGADAAGVVVSTVTDGLSPLSAPVQFVPEMAGVSV
jgi:hypothetical protein